MAIHGSNTTGLSVRANTNNINGAGKWLRIARFEADSSNTNDSCVSTFLVNMTGNESVSSVQTSSSFLITAKHTSKGSSPYYYATGTNIHVETLVANDLDTWAASTHLAMLVNRASMDFSAEVWIKTPNVSNKYVYVTHLGNSHNSTLTNVGFTLIDGAQTTNNHADSLPASIQSSSGSGVAVDTIVGTDSDKVVGNLTVNSKVGIGTSDPKKELVIVPEVSTNDAVIRIGANVNSDGNDMSGRVEIAEDADNDGEMTHGGFLEFDGDAAAGSGSGQLILGVRNNSTSDVDIVKIDRDAPANSILITDSGVTLENLGNAATATALETARNIALSGDVSGNVNFDGSSNVSITTAVANNSHTHVSSNITDATSANTANKIVERDGSGNFSAGTITATLDGSASSVDTTETVANNTHYLTFVDSSSTTSGATLRVDSGIAYNPHTNNLVISGDLYVRGGQVYGPTDATFELRSDGDMRFFIDDDNDSTAAKFRWYDDTTERMVLDQSGNLQIDGNLTVSGRVINGLADSYLMLRSDTHMYFDIDNDADGSSYFYFRNGGDGTVMSLNESGNLIISGDLTVSGGDIKGTTDSYLMLSSDTDMYFNIDLDGDSTSKFYFRSGNTSRMELDESGNLQIDGDLTVSGQNIKGPPNNNLFIQSDTNLYFDIDDDNDGTSKFYYRNGANTVIAELDESGNLQIDGDLTISGGNITNSVTFNSATTFSSTVVLTVDNDVDLDSGNITGGTLVIGKADSTGENLALDRNEIAARNGHNALRADGLALQAFNNADPGALVTIGYQSTAKNTANLKIGNVAYMGIDPNRNDTAFFGHYDHQGNDDYCLVMLSSGESFLNSKAGQDLNLCEGNNAYMVLSAASDQVHMKKELHWPALNAYIKADGHIYLDLDENDNSNSSLYVRDGDDNVRFQVPETGKCVINGATASGAGLVVNNNSNGAGYSAQFKNDGNNKNRYGIDIYCGADLGAGYAADGNVNQYYVFFHDGNGGETGTITGDGGTISYNPFTGCHIAKLKDGKALKSDELPDISFGHVVVIHETDATSPKQPEYVVEMSSKPKQKSIFGVYWNKIYEAFAEETDRHQIFSLGDGSIWVCSEGGNIEIGDFLCTSSVPGHAMKQDDDILRNYTIARATKAVNWDEEDSDKKLLPCTVHCG